MSYDFNQLSTCFEYRSLNPFGTGQCLTTPPSKKDNDVEEVSIPLEQGNVLRRRIIGEVFTATDRLNPFGTGQCLTTYCSQLSQKDKDVSIPLEQGNVLRQ